MNIQQSRQDACVAVDLQPRTGSMVSCGFDGMVWSTWRSIVVTGDETWWKHDGTMDDWKIQWLLQRTEWGKLPLIAHCYCCFFYSMTFSPLSLKKTLGSMSILDLLMTLYELASEWWRGLPPIFVFCRFRWWYSTIIPCCKRISAKALRFNSSARQLQVRTRDEQIK